MFTRAWIVSFLFVLLLSTSGYARDSYYDSDIDFERVGVFGGFGLGSATGNFSIDSEDNKKDSGTAVELHIGYAFPNQFGLGLGVSVNTYNYKVRLLKQNLADVALNFSALDFSAYYFNPFVANLGARSACWTE